MSSDAKEVLKEVLPKVARLRASCPVRRSLLHTQPPPRVCVCIIRDRCLIVLERPCWLALLVTNLLWLALLVTNLLVTRVLYIYCTY